MSVVNDSSSANKPKNGANLVEIVRTYKIDSRRLHHVLGIEGSYIECGQNQSLSRRKKYNKNHDTDEWYIRTTTRYNSHAKPDDIVLALPKSRTCTFKSSLIKKEFGLEGYIRNFSRENATYLIMTTSQNF